MSCERSWSIISEILEVYTVWGDQMALQDNEAALQLGTEKVGHTPELRIAENWQRKCEQWELTRPSTRSTWAWPKQQNPQQRRPAKRQHWCRPIKRRLHYYSEYKAFKPRICQMIWHDGPSLESSSFQAKAYSWQDKAAVSAGLFFLCLLSSTHSFCWHFPSFEYFEG